MIVFSTTLWVTEQGQKKLSDLFWVAWQRLGLLWLDMQTLQKAHLAHSVTFFF
jgi:hypothetical protein